MAVYRVRLDQRLVDLGLEPTRSQARQRILAGEVQVDGQPVLRPGVRVPADCQPQVLARARYVSRGGEKLAAALADLQVDPRGLACIDVGASTGGFTDCLLQAGARCVLALDVGHGQLAPALRRDPRVDVHEGAHVRDFTLPPQTAPADLLVADLAFISLTKVMAQLALLVRPGGRLLLLVKPQFELEPGAIGRTGVVRDPVLRERARVQVLESARAHGLQLLGACACSALDPRANEEGFLLLERAELPVCSASPRH